MISFKIFSANEPICLPESTLSMLGEYCSVFGEGLVGYCLYNGFLLLRFFDGEGYTFSVIPMDRDAVNAKDAVEAVCEYAVTEETGLTFVGISPELLGDIVRCFNYSEVCCEDACRSSFTVRIKSEADRLTEVFSLTEGDIELSELTEEDIPEYARLCRDEGCLEFWGYDYRGEAADADDGYFYKMQSAEFYRGTSVTFGARFDGRLIGEGSFYAFDYKGGAEIAFRLLPEYRGRGLGRALLEALLCAAEQLSLTAVYATVNKHNKPSVGLLSDYMDKESERDGILHFVLLAQEQ